MNDNNIAIQKMKYKIPITVFANDGCSCANYPMLVDELFLKKLNESESSEEQKKLFIDYLDGKINVSRDFSIAVEDFNSVEQTLKYCGFDLPLIKKRHENEPHKYCVFKKV